VHPIEIPPIKWTTNEGLGLNSHHPSMSKDTAMVIVDNASETQLDFQSYVLAGRSGKRLDWESVWGTDGKRGILHYLPFDLGVDLYRSVRRCGRLSRSRRSHTVLRLDSQHGRECQRLDRRKTIDRGVTTTRHEGCHGSAHVGRWIWGRPQ
jgi:hypothetical protein